MTALAEQRRDPWLGIELRHLVALTAIDTEGTFSDAALSLGYVQSAVSGQLATLERLTGTQLVERSRGPGPQRLTAAGQLLVAHAREILGEFETARGRLAARTRSETAGLRISVTSGMPDQVLGPILRAVFADSADLGVARVDTVDDEHVAEALGDGRADIALTTLPLADDDVATAELTGQIPVVLVQAGSPLARRHSALTLEQLSGLPLIAWREGCDPSRIERELAERALTADVIVRAASSHTVASLVRTGLGAAVLPRGTISEEPGLAVLDLEDSLPARVLGIAWLRSRVSDPRLRRFLDIAYRLRDEL